MIAPRTLIICGFVCAKLFYSEMKLLTRDEGMTMRCMVRTVAHLVGRDKLVWNNGGMPIKKAKSKNL